MTALGANDIDKYGVEAFQRSNLVVSDGVKVIVRNGGSIQNAAAESTVFSSAVTSIVQITQAAYDALSPPNSTTLYVIIG